MTPLLPGHDPSWSKTAVRSADRLLRTRPVHRPAVHRREDLARPELTDAHVDLADVLGQGAHGVISLHIACRSVRSTSGAPVSDRGVFMLELMISGMLRTPSAALPPVMSTQETAATASA